MAAVAALLDTRSALQSLRRTLPQPSRRVCACRSPLALRRALGTRLLDAVVVGHRVLSSPELFAFRTQFPALPVVVYGAFRPDDGELLFRLEEAGSVAAVAVEGVDDAVIGEMVRSATLSAKRRAALSQAPRQLRLTETIQRRTWDVLVEGSSWRLGTADLARRLDLSREHLSRQFAAGGAPNLKRVIDFLRIVTAAQLLTNPGYDLATVARLLGFSSVSHLHGMARRTAGLPAARLGGLAPPEILTAFIRVGTRSRRD